MQTVTGARPRATQSAKLRLSTPGGEGERHVGPGTADALDESEGDDVERRPREVHHRLAGREERAVVAHHQRVRELQAEFAAEGARPLGQAVRHLQRLRPLEVLLEVLGSRLDLGVAENVVEEPVHRLLAEKRGIELDGDVKAHLLHQEDGHRLDLVRRAAVEGRERHLVGKGRAEVEVAQASVLVRDLAVAAPRPRPARPSSRRSRTAPRASGPRRGRSPRSGRGPCRRGRGRPAFRAGPRPAPRRSASSPSRTRGGSPRGAAPGSTPRCSPRSACRCRAAGSSGGR